MNNPPQKLQWLVWGGLVLIVAVIGAAFVRSELTTPDLPLPVIGQIPDFHLTNQDNEAISMADLRGKVWVADIIFTRCPGPCRTITGLFQAMQSSLPADPSLRLVTLTSDPEYDTPRVMNKFAAEFHADSNRWWFLTGNKPEIRSLAVNDFKFVVVEKPPGDRTVPDDLFIHSTWFALVDRQGRVHGWIDRNGQEHAIFESDDPEAQARLQSAVKQLLRGARVMTIMDLPAVNGSLNGLSAVFLSFGYFFIRRGNRTAHRNCMIAAFVTSTLFLACYLTYHTYLGVVLHRGPTKFENPAWFRPIYLAILYPHLLLAIFMLPLIFMTLSRAMKQRFELHKKIARWTWPIWMYVSVTGVLIYLLLYQIFPQH